MARRDDREYRAIFEGGATQPARGPLRGSRVGVEAGMHRSSNAARLSPRAATRDGRFASDGPVGRTLWVPEILAHQFRKF